MFIAVDTAICSLGHGLHTFTAVPGSLNRVPASAGVRAGMSPLPGGRCVIPYGTRVSVAARPGCLSKVNRYTALIYFYFTYLSYFYDELRC